MIVVRIEWIPRNVSIFENGGGFFFWTDKTEMRKLDNGHTVAIFSI